MKEKKTIYPCRRALGGSRTSRAPDRSIALNLPGPRRLITHILLRLPLTALGGALAFTVGVFIFGAGAGVVFSVFNPPVTSLMLERYLDDHYAPRPAVFVPLHRLPASVPRMFLRLEDKRFYDHPGVDLAAIKNAYTQNKRWGRVIMGGSTITQQTVRSLFLSPDKNFMRKFVEAVMAVSLDLMMGKDRIMELYLNYIEWGKGVYGIGGAALYHYGKPVSQLTYEEYTRLAAIIVNPLTYDVNTLLKHGAMAARYNVLNATSAQAAVPERLLDGEEGEDDGDAAPPDNNAAVDKTQDPALQSPPEETPPPAGPVS